MKADMGHQTHFDWQTLLALGWLLLLPGFATADQNNAHFYGALVAEPCVIPPGEEEIQLDFGTIMDRYLYIHGRTLGQRFDIHLAECDLSLGNSVTVMFQGTESTALAGLLAIDGSGGASGIAIGLETLGGIPQPFNKNSGEYKLQPGNNMISLKAYVRGEMNAITTRSIGRGTFSATATFKLDYE